jgi:RimJ/RimL family protein N-acetyltransferase
VATLTTPRLALREMTDADLDDMAALLGDEQLMRYYPRPKTREEAQGKIGLELEKRSIVYDQECVIFAGTL